MHKQPGYDSNNHRAAKWNNYMNNNNNNHNQMMVQQQQPAATKVAIKRCLEEGDDRHECMDLDTENKENYNIINNNNNGIPTFSTFYNGTASKIPSKKPKYVVTYAELFKFLSLLSEENIHEFLRRDSCCLISDKYALAMVFTYFKRARLPMHEFTRTNFYLALYLANDIEEDVDEYKYEIFPWALGRKWRQTYNSFLRKRDALLRRIGYRAIVSRKCCEEVMNMMPDHFAWKRERSEDHGGATRAYLINRGKRYLSSKSNLTYDDMTLPRGPNEKPKPCLLCMISRDAGHHRGTKSILEFNPVLSYGIIDNDSEASSWSTTTSTVASVPDLNNNYIIENNSDYHHQQHQQQQKINNVPSSTSLYSISQITDNQNLESIQCDSYSVDYSSSSNYTNSNNHFPAAAQPQPYAVYQVDYQAIPSFDSFVAAKEKEAKEKKAAAYSNELNPPHHYHPSFESFIAAKEKEAAAASSNGLHQHHTRRHHAQLFPATSPKSIAPTINKKHVPKPALAAAVADRGANHEQQHHLKATKPRNANLAADKKKHQQQQKPTLPSANKFATVKPVDSDIDEGCYLLEFPNGTEHPPKITHRYDGNSSEDDEERMIKFYRKICMGLPKPRISDFLGGYDYDDDDDDDDDDYDDDDDDTLTTAAAASKTTNANKFRIGHNINLKYKTIKQPTTYPIPIAVSTLIGADDLDDDSCPAKNTRRQHRLRENHAKRH